MEREGGERPLRSASAQTKPSSFGAKKRRLAFLWSAIDITTGVNGSPHHAYFPFFSQRRSLALVSTYISPDSSFSFSPPSNSPFFSRTISLSSMGGGALRGGRGISPSETKNCVNVTPSNASPSFLSFFNPTKNNTQHTTYNTKQPRNTKQQITINRSNSEQRA